MMVPLAAIAIGAAVLGTQVLPPPEPTPLTEVQREMLISGSFEPDSFREPAFEALVENVRSWSNDAWSESGIVLHYGELDRFDAIIHDDPGAVVLAWGDVMMIDTIGDAFPGVARLTLRTGDRVTPLAVLVFTVDQLAPAIGDQVRVIGRAYKTMHLPTQHREEPMPFPAIVGQYAFTYSHPTTSHSMTGVAIITALTGALAVVLFIVVMGRHMLGRPAPRRSPLASTLDRPDDPSDA